MHMSKIKYEKEYVQYLIDIGVDSNEFESFLRNEIEFGEMIINLECDDFLSFQSFIKSKKIDELLMPEMSKDFKKKTYIDEVLERLHSKSDVGFIFSYSDDQIISNIEYLNWCEKNGISAYKCLAFLSDYINGEFNISVEFNN